MSQRQATHFRFYVGVIALQSFSITRLSVNFFFFIKVRESPRGYERKWFTVTKARHEVDGTFLPLPFYFP